MKTCVSSVSKDIGELKKLKSKLSVKEFGTEEQMVQDVVSRLDYHDLTRLFDCVDSRIKYLEDRPVTVDEEEEE